MTRTTKGPRWRAGVAGAGVAATLALAGCGGGDVASVGGTLSGLGTGLSLVAQNNNADTLTLTGNSTFTFATDLASGDAFNVTILTQPVGQTCTIANGAGTIDTDGDDVATVAIACATTASLGGTVSGLAAGTSVTLSNAGVSLPIASNGAFAFPGTLAAGTGYDVTVVVQPAGETCTVAQPSGAVADGVMASVAVTCQ